MSKKKTTVRPEDYLIFLIGHISHQFKLKVEDKLGSNLYP